MEKAAFFLSSLLGSGREGSAAGAELAATAASILIYPIKSCGGVSVHQAPVTSFGTLCFTETVHRNYLVHFVDLMNSHGDGSGGGVHGSGGIGTGWW
jgi:hypothetical protein